MPLGASVVVGEAVSLGRHLSKVNDNWYQSARISINGFSCRSICATIGFVAAIPMGGAPSPVVAQYSCSVTNPSASWLILSSPSTLALPAGATMACSSIDIKTCIDGALTLWGEMQAMVEKIAAAEEAKRAAPPDALPQSACLDSLRTPSRVSTLRSHASSRGRA
jgi:hypothetical protein